MSRGSDRRTGEQDRIAVLASIRGHESTVAHSWNHTNGVCPKCGCDQQVMLFCLPGSDLPRVRSCELEGEHVHRMCARCRYPWIERPLDQAMLAEREGVLIAESELAAALSLILERSGGAELAMPLVVAHRGWQIRFLRRVEEGTLVLTTRAAEPQVGDPVHPDFPEPGEVSAG
jgi:hypothetical protein